MNPISRKEIADGVFFNSVNDDRFKTMKLNFNMIMPLNANTASAYALLGGVMSRSCKFYPDFTELSKKLSSLYGADLSYNFSKLGERQVISFSISGLDDRYALEEKVSVSQQFSFLLSNIIFDPNLKDGKFLPSEVDQARRQLLDLIDSELSEKRLYANGRLIDVMCADEPYGIKRWGSIEKINTLNPTVLLASWKDMLRKSAIEIFYVGSSPTEEIEEVFAAAFERVNRNPATVSNKIIRKAGEVKRVTEEMEVSQAKLVMGFRTDCCYLDPGYNATRLMSAVLGGTATSKLFCNVREKQSLCYYCSSRFDSQKGILVIDSGVEGENLEKAESAILKEIESLKNGEISEFELESAKKAVINAFNSSNDTVGGIEGWYSSQIFNDKFRTIEEYSEIINSITAEQIVEAAKKLTLDTVFVLKNK